MSTLYSYFRGFVARIDLAPSTLTADTIYWAWKNIGNPGTQVYLYKIAGISTFIGTNAATRSIFGVHRKVGTPTGGTATAPSLLNSGSAAGINDVRFANAGLGGATMGANDRFSTFAQSSQGTSQNYFEMVFDDHDNPFIIESGEFFCIYAQSAIVSGAGFNGYALCYANL